MGRQSWRLWARHAPAVSLLALVTASIGCTVHSLYFRYAASIYFADRNCHNNYWFLGIESAPWRITIGFWAQRQLSPIPPANDGLSYAFHEDGFYIRNPNSLLAMRWLQPNYLFGLYGGEKRQEWAGGPNTLTKPTDFFFSTTPVLLNTRGGYVRFPPIVLAVLSSIGLWVVHRRFLIQRRIRQGLCRACGYDLRMTPGVCPECGDYRQDHPL